MLIDPAARAAKVFRPNAEPVLVGKDDPLKIGDVIPGFELLLGQILSEEGD
jgi:hypothetical protein